MLSQGIMMPRAACKPRARGSKTSMRHLLYIKPRLFASPAVALSNQRARAPTVGRAVCASTQQDDSQLQPHTEWGKLMAKSIAQLQQSSGSPQRFKIAGVSYTDDHTGENRQQLLAVLLRHGRNSSGAGIPLLFVKQPDNPVDPQAVAVMSAAVCSWLLQTGQPQPGQIGYVPAELTHHFDHFCSCGYSDWVWRPPDVPNSLLGCSVTANPTHRAAYVQVVPPRLAAFTDIKRWLPGHVWRAIEQRYSDRVLGSCQVTTLPSLPMFPNEKGREEVLTPRVYPIWRLLEYHKTLKLEGFQVLSAPLIFALALLDIDTLTALPPAAAPVSAAQNPGVVQELLEQLVHAYGDSDTALQAARASAADALLCCNSWYSTAEDTGSLPADVDAGVDVSLHASHAWSHADVDRYLQSSWERRQRLEGQEYHLDISFLLQEGLSAADWDSLPSAVRG